MSTHAVSRDSLFRCVNIKISSNESRKFLGDVVIHIVMFLPLLCGCIQIETGAGPKVIRVILSLDSNASCARVRENDGEVVLSCMVVESGFGSRVFVCARETRKVVEHSCRCVTSFLWRRDENGKGHVAIICLTSMLDTFQETSGDFYVLFLCESGALPFEHGFIYM